MGTKGLVVIDTTPVEICWDTVGKYLYHKSMKADFDAFVKSLRKNGWSTTIWKVNAKRVKHSQTIEFSAEYFFKGDKRGGPIQKHVTITLTPGKVFYGFSVYNNAFPDSSKEIMVSSYYQEFTEIPIKKKDVFRKMYHEGADLYRLFDLTRSPSGVG